MVYLRDYPALRIENQVLWFLEKVRNIWNVVSESAYQLNVAFSYKGFENIRGKTLFGRIRPIISFGESKYAFQICSHKPRVKTRERVVRRECYFIFRLNLTKGMLNIAF